MSSQNCCLLRLRVVADADLGALARVLERFQNLNVLPRSIVGEFGAGTYNIQVDTADVSEQTMTLIASKLGEVPCVLQAYWHYA